MSDPALIFLPWSARGGTLALPPDVRSAHPASRVSTRAEVTVNDHAPPAGVDVQLMGPGDVVGLVAQQVIRTEPAAGTKAFESNHLAAIEFDEPALPWLFTPASASEGKLRPWLCLVVVKVGPGVRLDVPGTGPLPVLRIGAPAAPEAELPDLDDSWAWAHAQVVPEEPGGDVVAALGGQPTRNLSRLICARLLEQQTEYMACVVPTFEAGRLAGLGREVGDAQGPAWQRAAGMPPIELPVYYHWQFATGPIGDFKSLALAIHGGVAEAGFGSRPIDLSQAGVGLSGIAGAEVRLGGALCPLETAPAAWTDPALEGRFADALTGILNAPDSAPPSNPLLAPPRYGAAYRPAPKVESGATGRWYEQLNTNPANRMAAALGVRIIQRDQEVLVASAWDQVGDLPAISAIGRLAETGIAVADRFHKRHLERLAPDTGVFVAAPLLRRMARERSPGEVALSVDLGGAVTAQSFSPAVRRAARIRGPVMRRSAADAATPSDATLATHITAIAARRAGSVDIGAIGTLEVLGTGTPSALAGAWDVIRPSAISDAPPRPTFAIRPPNLRTGGPGSAVFDPDILIARPSIGAALGHARILDRTARIGRGLIDELGPRRFPHDPDPPVHPPRPPHPPFHPPHDSVQAAAFRALAQLHLGKFLAPAPSGGLTILIIDVATAFNQLLALSTPQATFTVALGEFLNVNSGSATPDPAPVPITPPDLAPHFKAPMANALAELGQEWLVPGLDGVPANTALGLVTNSAFIQAFMIGLNHEFGRELMWREFPAPLDATFFQRFWDNAIDPDAPMDLQEMNARGDSPLDEDALPGDQFVLLIRSELLKRFPDAIVTAKKGEGASEQICVPMFSGALVPDVRYFGFPIAQDDAPLWSIVIAEQPGAPRFGFGVGAAPTDVSHAPAPDATSAALAHRLRLPPSRITIPVKVLMKRHEP